MTSTRVNCGDTFRAKAHDFSSVFSARLKSCPGTGPLGMTRVQMVGTHLALELEDHVHGGFHLNRLSIQQVGLVSPGLHGVHRGLSQHGRPADHAQALYSAGPRDGGLQNHRSLNPRGLRDDRIVRDALVDEEAFNQCGWQMHTGRNRRMHDDGRASVAEWIVAAPTRNTGSIVRD